MGKVCKKCGVEKSLEGFYRDKSQIDGYRRKCKNCESFHNKITLEKSLITPKSAKLCKKCGKEKLIDGFRKDKTKKDGHAHTCKDCRVQFDKENLNKIAERKKKYLQDPTYKLIVTTRTRLCDFIKSKNTKKTNKTMELLGCTPEFLRNYIEQKFTPEMNWENHGTYWHLDHIYPLSKVDVNDESQLKKACHYSNLQPLSVVENLRKGNTIPENFVWIEGNLNDEN